MPSKLETILTAFHAALSAGTTATVLRGEVLPTEVSRDGLVILRDGDPGEPEHTFSPQRWYYEHRAVVEIFVPGTADRDTLFDELRMEIGAVITTNRTLGGVCDWIEAEAPEPTDLPFDGADTIKAASIPVIVHFWTADPLS